jgi:hypothetical protein
MVVAGPEDPSEPYRKDRAIGIIQRRLDKHAHDIEVALPMLDALADLLDTYGGDSRPPVEIPKGSTLRSSATVMQLNADEVRGVGGSGQIFADGMRTRSGRQPSPKELRIWQSAAAGCVAYLRLLDPGVVPAYEAVLSASDQRLIKAMW